MFSYVELEFNVPNVLNPAPEMRLLLYAGGFGFWYIISFWCFMGSQGSYVGAYMRHFIFYLVIQHTFVLPESNMSFCNLNLNVSKFECVPASLLPNIEQLRPNS